MRRARPRAAGRYRSSRRSSLHPHFTVRNGISRRGSYLSAAPRLVKGAGRRRWHARDPAVTLQRMADLVLSELTDGIAVLTLNQPERRNALSRAMLAALKQELDRIGRDRAVRAVVLRAHGPVWSAGHDLREVVGGDEAA